METSRTLDLEQRLSSLSNYVKDLNVNRTENLERLAEQKINCLTEVSIFRDDLNDFFDRIEKEFRKEIAALENVQRNTIQSIVDELKNLDINILGLKMKLELFQKPGITSESNISFQELKNYVTACESKIETLRKENGVKEIDLYMSVKPEIQTLSCRLKSLGEVYVTYGPVDIEIDEKKSFIPEDENADLNGEQSLPAEDKKDTGEEEQTMHIVCNSEDTELMIKQEPKDPEFEFVHTAEETPQNTNIQKEFGENVLPSPIPVMRPLLPKPTSSASSLPSTSTTAITSPSIPLKLTTINNVPTLIAASQSEGVLTGPFIKVQQFPKPDKIPLKLSSNTQSINPNQMPFVFCQQPVGSQLSLNPRPILLKSVPTNTNLNSSQLSKRSADESPLCPKPAKRTATLSELAMASSTFSNDQPSSEQQSSETVVDNDNPVIQTVKEENLSFDELMAETQKTLSDGQYRMSNLHKHAQVKHARRFNKVSADDLKDMLDKTKESTSTKKNTKWGVKMFQQSGSSLTTGPREISSNSTVEDQPPLQGTCTQHFHPTDSRFSVIEDNKLDIQKHLAETQENETTLRATKRHVKLFEDFLKETHDETSEMHCLDPDALKKYLCSFFSTIKKQGGADYDPTSLKNMLHSFDRNLKKHSYCKSLIDCQDFLDVRQMLKERVRRLRAAKGNNPSTAYLTDQQVETLYQQNVLGCSSPDSILNTLVWHFTVEFGLKSVPQHHTLLWGDVLLKYDSRGNGYLELSRNLLKSYSGTYNNISATNNERCPISLYKRYKSLRPSDACGETDKFYLQSISNFCKDGKDPWYKKRPMGLHRLGSILRDIIKSGK